MKFFKNLPALLLVLCFLAAVLTGCSSGETGEDTGLPAETDSAAAEQTPSEGGEETDSTPSAEEETGEEQKSSGDTVPGADDMFTDRDLDPGYDEDEAVQITLGSDTAGGDGVSVTDSGVTITKEGVYVLTGTLADGSVTVDAGGSDKVQLVLDGADITSSDSAAILVENADKVFVTLAAGSENTLKNGGEFTDTGDGAVDAVIFSRDDLTVNGSGTLTVESPAGNGITSKDDLKLTGGTVEISCAGHGLEGKESVRVADGTFSLITGKDGIHSAGSDDGTLGFVYIRNGSFTVESQGDGISAASSLEILDGNFQLSAGGGSANGSASSSSGYGQFGGWEGWGGWDGWSGGQGGNQEGGRTGGQDGGQNGDQDGSQNGGRSGRSGTRNMAVTSAADDTETSTSMKGLKGGESVGISGGTFTIDSADDAVHSNGSIAISGGTFTIATGDDGIHADESLTFTDGTVTISECYEGMEALNLEISGGSISLTASDDGLNAAGGTDTSGTGGRDGLFGGGWEGGSNGSVVISGGDVYLQAEGDGIDSNGSLEISGGNVTICGPTTGDTATLDFNSSGKITGGTFIGSGASTMAQTFSENSQGVLAIRFDAQEAGTEVVIQDSTGAEILRYSPALSFAVFIYSDPSIVSGETYTVTVGGIEGEVTAG